MTDLEVAIADALEKRLADEGVVIDRSIAETLAMDAIESVTAAWRETKRESSDLPRSQVEWDAHCAFYRLVVDQRDFAWRENEELKRQIAAGARSILSAVGE